MLRINSLEMNNGIIEMYIGQISECYRAVLNDLVSAGNVSAVALALMVNTRDGAGLHGVPTAVGDQHYRASSTSSGLNNKVVVEVVSAATTAQETELLDDDVIEIAERATLTVLTFDKFHFLT